MTKKEEIIQLKFKLLKLRNELKKSKVDVENLGEDSRNLERANIKIREKHQKELNEKSLTISALERKNLKLEMVNDVLACNKDGYEFTMTQQEKKIKELETAAIGSENAVIIALANACNNK